MSRALLLLLAGAACSKPSPPAEGAAFAVARASSSGAAAAAPPPPSAPASILGGILAPKRLVAERRRVRYMYREITDDAQDGGWRVFSGDEDQAYADNPDNLAFFAPATITAIDPDVAALLGTPAPCAYERARATDAFHAVPAPQRPAP